MAISTDLSQRSSQPSLSFQATSILSLGNRQWDIVPPVEIRGKMDEAAFWIPPKSYAASTYPYFDSVFWIDSWGEQRSKWAVQTQTTPLINVYPRDYFSSIFQCWSWIRRCDGKPVHFYVDPIYSWNAGENLTIYSVPLQDLSDANLPCPSASDDGSAKLAVAALVIRPLSLIRPVVPPSFGYAIIRDNGSVLFHVDDTHNLRENLFEETTNNKLLRSAVFGHAAEWLDAEYGGKPHRLYIRPLDNLPWFLVVYRDKELITTANLELLSVAMTLFLAYLSLLIVFLLLYLWLSADHLRWLWPTPERTGIYWLFTGLNLLLSLGLCLWLDHMTDRLTYLLGVMALAPVVEIVFVYFIILGKGLTSESWKRDSAAVRLGYGFAVAFIFLLLSVLPALFKLFASLAQEDKAKQS